MGVLTKHFWDVYIGVAILFGLGSILEPPTAVLILVFVALEALFFRLERLLG